MLNLRQLYITNTQQAHKYKYVNRIDEISLEESQKERWAIESRERHLSIFF